MKRVKCINSEGFQDYVKIDEEFNVLEENTTHYGIELSYGRKLVVRKNKFVEIKLALDIA